MCCFSSTHGPRPRSTSRWPGFRSKHDALGRATVEAIGGAKIRIATAEDLVVLKSVAGRSKDWSDVEELLLVCGATMDLLRMRRIVSQFATLLEEPDRAARLDACIAAAGLEEATRSRETRSRKVKAARLRKKPKKKR